MAFQAISSNQKTSASNPGFNITNHTGNTDLTAAKISTTTTGFYGAEGAIVTIKFTASALSDASTATAGR